MLSACNIPCCSLQIKYVTYKHIKYLTNMYNGVKTKSKAKVFLNLNLPVATFYFIRVLVIS